MQKNTVKNNSLILKKSFQRKSDSFYRFLFIFKYLACFYLNVINALFVKDIFLISYQLWKGFQQYQVGKR